jgi:3-methyladenine DNA glycosylase/8-oxoguanine DNA glycosylase
MFGLWIQMENIEMRFGNIQGPSIANALEKVSERWKPYRAVALWYLWRWIDGER